MVTAVYHDHWREGASVTVRYRVSFDETDLTVTDARLSFSVFRRYRLYLREHMVLMLLRSDDTLCSVRHSYSGVECDMDSRFVRDGEVTNGYTMVALDGGVAW